MKRAILVTTSTVVGVAAVLGYKPNSDTAKTLLDITGANNTASTTQSVPTETAAPTTAAPEPTATATPSASKSPKPSASSSPKPTKSSAAQATASPTATQAPTPTPTATAAVSKTLTGDAARAISHGNDYGTVTVTVTLVDGKMTKIAATQNPEGRNFPYIQAVRQYLVPAVLKAQRADVGYVQGATGSSEAFVASLQSALNKA